jgi:lysophospholipase L1-like esterase
MRSPVAASPGYAGTGYFPYANQTLNNAFVWMRNAGISGDTTAQMLARLAYDVLYLRPAWVSALGGVNDITAGTASATTIANLTAIYDQVLAAGATVIACVVLPTTSFNTAPRKAGVDAINTAIRAYADSHADVVLVDWWASWSDPDEETGNGGYNPLATLTVDGKHPSAAGAAILGAAWAAAIAAALEE